jgi:hypothetical protein
MSKVTELASGQLAATETITVELIEANETPAVVIVRWPSKPSVSIPVASPVPLTVQHGVRGCCRTAGSDQTGAPTVNMVPTALERSRARLITFLPTQHRI